MKGILTNLNENKIGSIDHYVIWFMGSIMAIDRKAYWYTEANARRALSVMLSREYNKNPALKKLYAKIGDYRKSLEENTMVKICKSTELDVQITLRK